MRSVGQIVDREGLNDGPSGGVEWEKRDIIVGSYRGSTLPLPLVLIDV
jgi:hypothetical protein